MMVINKVCMIYQIRTFRYSCKAWKKRHSKKGIPNQNFLGARHEIW